MLRLRFVPLRPAFVAVVFALLLPLPSFAIDLEVPLVYPTIQSAILASNVGDEVVVAPGVYNEDIDFAGRAITVRSVGGAAATTIQGTGLAPVVRFATGETQASVLDGFTITGGNSIEGGGIYCIEASPVIRGCRVTGNSAQGGPVGFATGGGVAFVSTFNGCFATFENNEVFANSATSGGGIAVIADGGDCSPLIRDNSIHGNSASQGGGLFTNIRIFSSGTLVPEITGNDIFSNSSSGTGGGIALWQSSARVIGNRIHDNTGHLGGGIGVLEARPTIVNNEIVRNHASVHGGGVFVEIAFSIVIVNNTIADNDTAGFGGGLFTHLPFMPSPVILANNIVWSNQAAQAAGVFHDNVVPANVFSNIVTDGHPGSSNSNVDPLFVDATASDYHLSPTSPAVDAGFVAPGLPTTDLDGGPRIVNLSIDLGAFELQLVPFVRGDLNASGTVNLADAVILLSALFIPGSPALVCQDPADCNDDGSVNLQDPIVMLNALFLPGSAPIPPPHVCGDDPTPDAELCSAGTWCP